MIEEDQYDRRGSMMPTPNTNATMSGTARPVGKDVLIPKVDKSELFAECGLPPNLHGKSERFNESMAIANAKPMLTLIPTTAIRQEARAMEDGYRKYGRETWRMANVVSSLSLMDKALRHIYHWIEGEETAKDSGVHHLAHARAILGIALDSLERGSINDDRS